MHSNAFYLILTLGSIRWTGVCGGVGVTASILTFFLYPVWLHWLSLLFTINLALLLAYQRWVSNLDVPEQSKSNNHHGFVLAVLLCAGPTPSKYTITVYSECFLPVFSGRLYCFTFKPLHQFWANICIGSEPQVEPFLVFLGIPTLHHHLFKKITAFPALNYSCAFVNNLSGHSVWSFFSDHIIEI